MTHNINTAPMQKYREAKMEVGIQERSAHPVMGGTIICLKTGRSVAWSISLKEKDGGCEFFLSADGHQRVTRSEMKYVMRQFRLRPLEELNATSQNQQFLRCWKVRSL